MAGAFYLTQGNPELADHYEIGTEIVTWQNLGELVAKVRYYLAKPGDAEQIRHAGAARARESHTWRRRFETAFAAMGLCV